MEKQRKSSNSSSFEEERNLSAIFDSMEEQSKSPNRSFESKSSASNTTEMEYRSSNIKNWLNEPNKKSSLSIPKHDIPETSMKQTSLNQKTRTNCFYCINQTVCFDCISQIFQDFLMKVQLKSSNIENCPEFDEIWSFSSIQKYDVSEISVEQASLNRADYLREILQEFFMNAQYRMRFPNIENFSESNEKSPITFIPKHDVPEISLEQSSLNQADCLSRKSFDFDTVDGEIENMYVDNEEIKDIYVEEDSSSLETASNKKLKSDKELESDKELRSDKELGSNKQSESDKEFELEKIRSANELGSDKELGSIIELKSGKELESDKELGSDKELLSVESLELDKAAEIHETLEMQNNFYWKENDYEFNKLHPSSICSDLSWKNLKNKQEHAPFSPVSSDIDEIDSESIENMEVTNYTNVDGISESKMFLDKLQQVEADSKAQKEVVELYRNYPTLPISLKTDKRSSSESSITEPTKSAEFSCMNSIESRIETLHTLRVESGNALMEISEKENSADSVTNINDTTLNPSTSISDNAFKIISDKGFMDDTKSISEIENRRDEINQPLKTELSSTKSFSMEPSSTKSSPTKPSEDDQVKSMKTQESKNSTKNVCVNTSDSPVFESADNQAETTSNKEFENAMDPTSLTNQLSEIISDIIKNIPPKLTRYSSKTKVDETQKTDNQAETTSNKEFENAMDPTSLTNQLSEIISDIVKDIPPKVTRYSSKTKVDETQKTDNQAETTSNKEFENAMAPTSLINQLSEIISDIVKNIPPKLTRYSLKTTVDETQKTDNQAETTSNKEFENAVDPTSLINQLSEIISDIVKNIPPKLTRYSSKTTVDETQKTDNQAETTSNKEFENAVDPTSLINQLSEIISDIVKNIPPKLTRYSSKTTVDETQKTDNQAETTSNKEFENAVDPTSLINQLSEIISDIVKNIPPKLTRYSSKTTVDETQKTDNQAETTSNKEFENAVDPTSLINQPSETSSDIIKDILPKLIKYFSKTTVDKTQKTDNQAETTSNKEFENSVDPTSLTNQSSETISNIVKDISPKLRTTDEIQKADNQAETTSNKVLEDATSLINRPSKTISNIVKDIFPKLKTDEIREIDNRAEATSDEEFENAMDSTSTNEAQKDEEPEEYPDKIKKEIICSSKCCLIILLSFIVLILSLFLFMLPYYSRPSDINQNDENVDTFAIVELEEKILDHDATVRVLTEYLERDTSLLKVVALIGDTSDDKPYTVDIIKKRLRKRRNNSSSSSLPSFVVLENLRVEHSTVVIDYVKTYREAYGNQEFAILAIFKVEQIDDDLMRADIDHVINKVKDIFVEANIIMKIIPFKPLSEDALEKYIINTAENIGQTLSQDQIDYYKRRLIEDDTDCQACCC